MKLDITQKHINRAKIYQMRGEPPSQTCPIVLAGKEAGYLSWSDVIESATPTVWEKLRQFAGDFDLRLPVSPFSVIIRKPRGVVRIKPAVTQRIS